MNNKPEWLDEVIEKYSAGMAHMFALHFNVHDHFIYTNSLRDYLAQAFGRFELIMFYNVSAGLTFWKPTMREMFIAAAGLQPAQLPTSIPAEFAALDGAMNNREPEVEIPRAPAQVLPLLEQVLRQGTPDKPYALLIIDYAEAVAPAGQLAALGAADREAVITLARWGREIDIQMTGNMIFLLTANIDELHPLLREPGARIEPVNIPLPDYTAREDYIEYCMVHHTAFQQVTWEMSVAEFTAATAGLGKVNLEDIVLRAAANGGHVTMELVKQRKREVIADKFAGIISIIEPEGGFELLGGLPHAKGYLRGVAEMLRRGSQSTPQGILLTGPAGTGKSVAAECLAKEAGFNCVRFSLGKLLGKYVGQSEGNLESALRMIENLAPTIVFIDEVDQQLQRGDSGDSGVSRRLFGRMLEFMSDTRHRGKILFLAATNRPDMLDAALKRAGRFDVKLLFGVPDAVARADIIRAMCVKYGLAQFTPDDETIALTEGWTGAELEKCIVKARRMAEVNSAEIDATYFGRAAQSIIPSTTQIEFMTAIGLLECDDLELIPPDLRELARDRDQLRKLIEQYRPR